MDVWAASCELCTSVFASNIVACVELPAQAQFLRCAPHGACSISKHNDPTAHQKAGLWLRLGLESIVGVVVADSRSRKKLTIGKKIIDSPVTKPYFIEPA